MSPVDDDPTSFAGWSRQMFQAFLSAYGLIEKFLHQQLTHLEIPAMLQGPLIIAVAVLIIVLVNQLFSGLFKLLLITLLVLMILQVASKMVGL